MSLLDALGATAWGGVRPDNASLEAEMERAMRAAASNTHRDNYWLFGVPVTTRRRVFWSDLYPTPGQLIDVNGEVIQRYVTAEDLGI